MNRISYENVCRVFFESSAVWNEDSKGAESAMLLAVQNPQSDNPDNNKPCWNRKSGKQYKENR